MNIAIVGTGYVGLVTGACFARMGNNVWCVDIDENKINSLKAGIIPIYEPGLSEIVVENSEAGRLHFTTNLKDCIHNVQVVFCAVGTPPDEDGSADLKYVLAVAKQFGELIDDYKIFVTKSTVPVGTANKVQFAILQELLSRGNGDAKSVLDKFDVVSNPEFLKEGSAVNDFLHPDRVVVGANTEKAKKIMEQIYKPFMLNGDKLIFTDVASAEMIKYAANSMLATRISFMNDIANLCDKLGANVDAVRKGIGADTRIGSKFLYPGCGYGGSCFPKDVKALIKTADKEGYDMKVLKAVEEVNEQQKHILYSKLCEAFDGDVNNKNIALWGLAFKPNTDDMREAPALTFISDVKDNTKETNIWAYDPIAIDECKRRIGDSINYCDDPYCAASDADAIVLVTEWEEFRMLDWNRLEKCLRGKIIIDGRNLYSREEMKSRGYKYYAIGK